MLKRLFLLLFAVMSYTSYAQLSIELKGGINVSKLDVLNDQQGTPVPNYNYKTSFNVGPGLIYKGNQRLGFIVDFLYSRKGFKVNEPEVQVTLHYLNLPLLVRLELVDALFVEFGPEVGYLLGATAKTPNGSSNVSNLWDNAVDIGLGLGLSHAFEMLEVSARFSHGLTSVQDIMLIDQNGNDNGQLMLQNRSIQFAVAYNFPLQARN